MRKLSLILVLAMGLGSVTDHARAEQDLELLEALVIQEPPMQQRLYTFFKKHKVKRPLYHATLLASKPMSERKRKIMAAIIVPESRGNAAAVNRHSGATGLYQIMPSWKRVLNIKGSLKDPVVNLDAASKIYDIHMKDAKGREALGLYAFSGRTPGYVNKVRSLAETI